MAQQGKLDSWQGEKGFGFIVPAEGGERVFVHISAFKRKHRRPNVGEFLLYELGKDDKGRARAANVVFVNNEVKTPTPGRGWLSATLGAFVFLCVVAVLVYFERLPVLVLGVYLVASAVSLIIYEVDKSAARNGDWRVRESLLLLIGLVGGWPGALVAQKLLRHKSSKPSFQAAFWFTVVVNCAVLVVMLRMGGQLTQVLARLASGLAGLR